MKFKLFGRLRDDDESSSGSGLSGGSLERTVESMFEQGYSEEEIKEELKGQYTESEINRAVNNTVTSSATEDTGGPEPMSTYQSDDSGAVSPMDEGFDQDDELGDQQDDQGLGQNEPPGRQQGPSNQAPPQPQGSRDQEMPPLEKDDEAGDPDTVDPAVEELIETIVAEQFNRVEEEFEKVYAEMDIMIDELEDLEDRVQELEIRDDEDQTQVIQKMDELEEDINSYQSRIGGLEKAFQQVLPSLVENVKDLTTLVQEIKAEKGIETTTELREDDVEDIDMSDW